MELPSNTHPDLQSLIPPITYLIRAAIFRPHYEANQQDISTLGIRPLAELVDMYHTRKASKRADKIYALHGISSDDSAKTGLSANYKASWGEVFQRIIRFTLPGEISFNTWDDRGLAVIQEKCYMLGRVKKVDNGRNDLQTITIAWNDVLWKKELALGIRGDPSPPTRSSQHQLRASAKLIQYGDGVCYIQGASRPMIVRLCDNYAAIIRISAPIPYPVSEQSALSRLVETVSPTDIALIWDWDVTQYDSSGNYACLNLQGGPERPWTKFQFYLDGALRL